jgi:hypothetical protein
MNRSVAMLNGPKESVVCLALIRTLTDRKAKLDEVLTTRKLDQDAYAKHIYQSQVLGEMILEQDKLYRRAFEI